MPTHPVPRYDLDSCLAVARVLFDHGGSATSATLAGLLGYKSMENGAYLSRIGAAKQFGVVAGQARDLQVTDLARDIFQPDYPETAERARVEAFLHVPLFRAVFERLEGRQLPPTKEGLANMLMREFSINERLSALAAARLTDSAEQAGLFRSAGPTRMVKPGSKAVVQESANPGSANIPLPPSEPPSPPKYPKLLEGALEQLPASTDDTWSEERLVEWLELFELSLRVVYKLPRKRGGVTS